MTNAELLDAIKSVLIPSTVDGADKREVDPGSIVMIGRRLTTALLDMPGWRGEEVAAALREMTDMCYRGRVMAGTPGEHGDWYPSLTYEDRAEVASFLHQLSTLTAERDNYRESVRNLTDVSLALTTERNMLTAALATAREALELLHSCQNGCPLHKYEADWNRAMQMAEAIIFSAATDALPGEGQDNQETRP